MKKLLTLILAGLILAGLSGCVEEKKMSLIYVSDYSNLRIVVLDSDLNWVDSFSDSGTSEQSTIDGDYLFTVGPLQINKYLRKSPYTLVDTKSTSGFYDIDSDDDFVYIGTKASSDYKIQIYKKSDLSFVDEFITGLTKIIEGIAVDDTYIYCFAGNVLKKFKKSDHSEVASVNILTQDGIGTWVGMDKDSTYLYFTAALAGNGELIGVYNKSDLSQYKTITISDTNNSMDVAVEGDYAYQVDYGAHVVRKVQISTGNIVATFGEVGVSGDDQSHLNSPRGVAIGPEEEQKVFVGYIG